MKRHLVLLPLFAAIAPLASAHPPGEDDTVFHTHQHAPPTMNVQNAGEKDPSDHAAGRPAAAVPFAAFPKLVTARWDNDFLYVDSHGMPDHPMMVGITAWQQQVPIPQDYTGENTWRIPLKPVPAAKPVSAKDDLFRGAIALAANGVPVFNPIKNDGKTDTFLAGELDEYGGHAGRGDDYHYHLAPLHLQTTLGREQPVAYALDGYPVYGLLEDHCPLDSKAPAVPLDGFKGHAAADRPDTYHYHASKNYPYLNGGMHGQVTVRGGQIDPQPRSESPRPPTRPLRGAQITEFEAVDDRHWTLTYSLGEKSYELRWSLREDGAMVVETPKPDGGVDRQVWPRR